jgi:hypothetical protein
MKCLLIGVSLWVVGAAWAQTNVVLPNGGLERPDPVDARKPADWALPDGLGVQWTHDAAAPQHGKCLRLDTTPSEQQMQAQWTKMGLTNIWHIPKPAPNAIADTYGLSYDSALIPVKSGQAYRITFDYKGAAGGKVWVRCYGVFDGERRQRYEKVVACEPTAGQWLTFSTVLHPTLHRPDCTLMKVMLFATHPAGQYWFDNIRLVEISAEEYARAKSAGTQKRGR